MWYRGGGVSRQGRAKIEGGAPEGEGAGRQQAAGAGARAGRRVARPGLKMTRLAPAGEGHALVSALEGELGTRRYFSSCRFAVQGAQGGKGRQRVSVGDFVLVRTRTVAADAEVASGLASGAGGGRARGYSKGSFLEDQVARVVSLWKRESDRGTHREGDMLAVVRWMWRRSSWLHADEQAENSCKVHADLLKQLPKKCRELYYCSKSRERANESREHPYHFTSEAVVHVENFLRRVEVKCLAKHKRNNKISLNDVANLDFFYRLAIRCEEPHAVFHALGDVYRDEACPLVAKLLTTQDYAVKAGFKTTALPPSVFNGVMEYATDGAMGCGTKDSHVLNDAYIDFKADNSAERKRKREEEDGEAADVKKGPPRKVSTIYKKRAGGGGDGGAGGGAAQQATAAKKKAAALAKPAKKKVTLPVVKPAPAKVRRPATVSRLLKAQPALASAQGGRVPGQRKQAAVNHTHPPGYLNLEGIPATMLPTAVCKHVREHLKRHGAAALAKALKRVTMPECWTTVFGQEDPSWLQAVVDERNSGAEVCAGVRTLVAHFERTDHAHSAREKLAAHPLLLVCAGLAAPAPVVAMDVPGRCKGRPEMGPDPNPGFVINHQNVARDRREHKLVAGHFAARNTLETRHGLEWLHNAEVVRMEKEQLQELHAQQLEELRRKWPGGSATHSA